MMLIKSPVQFPMKLLRAVNDYEVSVVVVVIVVVIIVIVVFVVVVGKRGK